LPQRCLQYLGHQGWVGNVVSAVVHCGGKPLLAEPTGSCGEGVPDFDLIEVVGQVGEDFADLIQRPT
jgi:hypothetical protein